jgi:hypothetical protein
VDATPTVTPTGPEAADALDAWPPPAKGAVVCGDTPYSIASAVQ